MSISPHLPNCVGGRNNGSSFYGRHLSDIWKQLGVDVLRLGKQGAGFISLLVCRSCGYLVDWQFFFYHCNHHHCKYHNHIFWGTSRLGSVQGCWWIIMFVGCLLGCFVVGGFVCLLVNNLGLFLTSHQTRRHLNLFMIIKIIKFLKHY